MFLQFSDNAILSPEGILILFPLKSAQVKTLLPCGKKSAGALFALGRLNKPNSELSKQVN